MLLRKSYIGKERVSDLGNDTLVRKSNLGKKKLH